MLRILFIFVFIGNFYFAQKASFSIDRSLIKKAEVIQKECEDSISRYDIKLDKDLWKEKYSEFYRKKIVKLKTLYEKLYNEDQVSNGTSQTVTSIIDKDKNFVPITEIENYSQLSDLNVYLRNNFPSDYFMNSSGKFSCKLNFLVDVDGVFKKIKYSGDNEEFNLISAIFLYSVKKVEKPLLYKDKPVKGNFSQPITLIIE